MTRLKEITFEYVMLAGINDSEAQARRLARLLVGQAAKVNLIPFNEFPGADFHRSADETRGSFPSGAREGRYHYHHAQDAR